MSERETKTPGVQRHLELGLGDDLLQLVREGPPSATAPATTLPTSVYTSDSRHRSELKAIAASPAAVVAASEIGTAGDFVTAHLGGVPVIVARDRDGHVSAMRNVCAHRGSTVESRPSGSARIFSCHFHGWSYELDGSLRSISDPTLFSSRPCELGLRRLPCEERHGIVWVTGDPESASAGVRAWLGDELDDLLTELGLAQMVSHASAEYDLACNWKLLTDGFLELYHLKYLHRSSIGPYFPANLTRLRPMGEHFVNWLPKNRLVRDLTEKPRDEWRVLDHVTGAIVLVPGTVIQWQAGHVELFSFRPHATDPGRTMCRLTMLVPATRRDEVDLWNRNWERVCDTIPAEDFAAAVDIQANIASGATNDFQIGAIEHFLCEHLHAVDRAIRRCE
jgi:phenylpropionate dioxygenase-like ring-hydroxylating dioxygenase large terminal subunit